MHNEIIATGKSSHAPKGYENIRGKRYIKRAMSFGLGVLLVLAALKVPPSARGTMDWWIGALLVSFGNLALWGGIGAFEKIKEDMTNKKANKITIKWAISLAFGCAMGAGYALHQNNKAAEMQAQVPQAEHLILYPPAPPAEYYINPS